VAHILLIPVIHVLNNTATIQHCCAKFFMLTFFYPCHSLCSVIQLTLLSTNFGAHLSNPYHSLCSITQQNLLSHILGAHFSYPFHSLCSIISQQYSIIAQHSWCTHFLSLSSTVLNNDCSLYDL